MIYEPENLKNKRTMYEKKAKMYGITRGASYYEGGDRL